MRILCMPQAFKGCLSSGEVASAMARGCLAALPDSAVTELPMADGGDDTLDVLVRATEGRRFTAEVQGPLGDIVQADWGVLGNSRTAVIEMAQASGLRLLDSRQLDPRAASTYGTGQLVLAALDRGYSDILIAVGGSATIDGGTGALAALGIRFVDGGGCLLPPGGASLRDLVSIDTSGLDRRLADARIRIACDVDIPMVGRDGPRGFMAQKGCDTVTINQLAQNLAHYCRVVHQTTGVDLRALPLTGPAGGLAGGLHAFLGAQLTPGPNLVLDALGVRDRLADTDLVLVGEGRLDKGSLKGKGTLAVARAAQEASVPVFAICGELALTLPVLRPYGIKEAVALVGPGLPIDQALAHASGLIEQATTHLISARLTGSRLSCAGL